MAEKEAWELGWEDDNPGAALRMASTPTEAWQAEMRQNDAIEKGQYKAGYKRCLFDMTAAIEAWRDDMKDHRSVPELVAQLRSRFTKDPT